jgi:hypothetical protein
MHLCQQRVLSGPQSPGSRATSGVISPVDVLYYCNCPCGPRAYVREKRLEEPIPARPWRHRSASSPSACAPMSNSGPSGRGISKPSHAPTASAVPSTGRGRLEQGRLAES